MKKIKKLKKILFLFLIITAAVLFSCSSDKVSLPVMNELEIPEGASVSVRDIKIKGFTLDWTLLPDKDYEYGYEYAIAASHDGHIENYETALDNGKIVLGFTASYITNGTYKVKNMLAGKKYDIKIFVQSKNMKPTEYLKTKTELPYIDEAEIVSVTINGNKALYDKTDDSFSYYYLLGLEENKNYTFTYELMRGCSLYINGEKTDKSVIPLTPHEPLEVTVVYERTQAARDYTIYAGSVNNGLPIVILDTKNGKSINSKDKAVAAHLKIIDCKENPLGIGLYDGDIEIKGRGSSSWGMPKQGWNFTLAEKSQILDMAPHEDWILLANYSDKSLMRNYMAYEFSRDLGAAFSPKMRFVDLIYNGRYHGTYLIGERIRVGKGRLDLPKLKKDMTDEYDLTGTYILEVSCQDRLKRGENIFTSKHVKPGYETIWGRAEGDMVIISQPSPANLSKEAFNYIREHFNKLDDALFGPDFKDPEKGYRKYMDTASWIDWYLVNEFFKNIDADFRLSTYLYKPRGDDKIYMGPIWDFDLTAGNADYRGGDDPWDWYIRTSIWHERLFEDEAFAKEFKDRWNYLKDNGYFDAFFKRIDDTAEMLEKSAKMNFERWNTLGKYDWPNGGNWWDRTTYQDEVDYLKDWLTARFKWMDKEINK